MREDTFTDFSIFISKSKLHKLECAIIIPPNTNCPADVIKRLRQAFINYDLAIKPNVPTIILQLDTEHLEGTLVYGGQPNCPEIYHIPPYDYDELDNMFIEAPFAVSIEFLKQTIEARSLNKSIFTQLEPVRHEQGLNVLGIQHETTET